MIDEKTGAAKVAHGPIGGDGDGAIRPVCPFLHMYVPTPLRVRPPEQSEPHAEHASVQSANVPPQDWPEDVAGLGGGGGGLGEGGGDGAGRM